MKYRLGKKQKRAVLDTDGKEIIVFPAGKEQMAKDYVDFLNGEYIKVNDVMKHLTAYSFEIGKSIGQLRATLEDEITNLVHEIDLRKNDTSKQTAPHSNA